MLLLVFLSNALERTNRELPSGEAKQPFRTLWDKLHFSLTKCLAPGDLWHLL